MIPLTDEVVREAYDEAFPGVDAAVQILVNRHADTFDEKQCRAVVAGSGNRMIIVRLRDFIHTEQTDCILCHLRSSSNLSGHAIMPSTNVETVFKNSRVPMEIGMVNAGLFESGMITPLWCFIDYFDLTKSMTEVGIKTGFAFPAFPACLLNGTLPSVVSAEWSKKLGQSVDILVEWHRLQKDDWTWCGVKGLNNTQAIFDVWQSEEMMELVKSKVYDRLEWW